ncbi:MAG: hypothetical protein IJO07_01220 [Peptococcaceae bacterium]|nr:hypothetical protein [Peptococcaceae bacterium]
MSRESRHYVFAGVGVLFFIAGCVLLLMISNPQGVWQVLPYICIGAGCGAFGYGAGEIATDRACAKNPQLRKQMEIEKNDERNIAIANQAKAKAYDAMLYVFGALMLVFALMNVDMWPILLLVAGYLLVVGIFIFYLNKYQKEQ